MGGELSVLWCPEDGLYWDCFPPRISFEFEPDRVIKHVRKHFRGWLGTHLPHAWADPRGRFPPIEGIVALVRSRRMAGESIPATIDPAVAAVCRALRIYASYFESRGRPRRPLQRKWVADGTLFEILAEELCEWVDSGKEPSSSRVASDCRLESVSARGVFVSPYPRDVERILWQLIQESGIPPFRIWSPFPGPHQFRKLAAYALKRWRRSFSELGVEPTDVKRIGDRLNQIVEETRTRGTKRLPDAGDSTTSQFSGSEWLQRRVAELTLAQEPDS